MHSVFGFESKNGHLKRHIHGRGNVVPQLIFNIDVSHTLQLVHYKLAQCESEKTMNFSNASSELAPRSNSTQIGEHLYIIGRCHVKSPTSEQCAALGVEDPIACFYKLYKNGVLYRAESTGVCGKRDSTVCAFQMRRPETFWTNCTVCKFTFSSSSYSRISSAIPVTATTSRPSVPTNSCHKQGSRHPNLLYYHCIKIVLSHC